VNEVPPRARARGWTSLYALACALLAAAVVALTVSVAGFLESTGLLLVSAVLSGLAIVAAVTGLILPRRR
jgi:hypothetical protein